MIRFDAPGRDTRKVLGLCKGKRRGAVCDIGEYVYNDLLLPRVCRMMLSFFLLYIYTCVKCGQTIMEMKSDMQMRVTCERDT